MYSDFYIVFSTDQIVTHEVGIPLYKFQIYSLVTGHFIRTLPYRQRTFKYFSPNMQHFTKIPLKIGGESEFKRMNLTSAKYVDLDYKYFMGRFYIVYH